MRATIAILPGDGIGPEVTAQARRVLEQVAGRFGHEFEFVEALVGGAAIDATGSALPDDTLALCRRADAILLGAVGGPKWSDPAAEVRPEQGLLALRGELGLYANLRPVAPHRALFDASPLKAERLEGVDLMVVRELTGGMYFGDKIESNTAARDVCDYSRAEVERIARVAGRLAAARQGRLVSVAKANVLATSRLWRTCMTEVIRDEFPGLELEHMLVDAAAMHLLQRPADFDVLVTENLFGDILTDEASVLAGSMGLLPSASLGDDGCGLYEPIHGSAPDIAGQGIANPCGAILSAAMLLRHSLQLDAQAQKVEQAVVQALDGGMRTADIAAAGQRARSTEDAANAIIDCFLSD